MNITVLTPTGRKAGTLRLPKEIFAAKVSQKLMAQAVRVYLSNQRQSSKKTKSRGEVSGSGRKIYRQKGTGNARHGDRYAPIFTGGGVAHGPKGNENYKRKLTRSMRQKALLSALSAKAKAREIAIVDKLDSLKPKTKLMRVALDKILSQSKQPENAKVSLILPEVTKSVARSARNLKRVKILQARQLTTYEILSGGTLIFLKPSIKVIQQTFTPHRQNKTSAKFTKTQNQSRKN